MDGDRLVLEELGQVEDQARDEQRQDDLPGLADRAERLRFERVTDHDVPIDGESQGEPDRGHLEGEGRRVNIGEHVGVYALIPGPALFSGMRFVDILHQQQYREDKYHRVTDRKSG